MNGNGFSDGSFDYGAGTGYGDFTDAGLPSDSSIFSTGYADSSSGFSGDLSPGGFGASDQYSYTPAEPGLAPVASDLGNASSADSTTGIGSSILGGLESAGSFLGNIGSDLLSGIGYVGDAALGGLGAALGGTVQALGGAKGIGSALGGAIRGALNIRPGGSLLGSVLGNRQRTTAQRGALSQAYGGYSPPAAPPAIPSARMLSSQALNSAILSQFRSTRSRGGYGTPFGVPGAASRAVGGCGGY